MEDDKRGFPEGGTEQHVRHAGPGGEFAEDAAGVRASGSVMVAATFPGRRGHRLFYLQHVVCDRGLEVLRASGDGRINRSGDSATGD